MRFPTRPRPCSRPGFSAGWSSLALVLVAILLGASPSAADPPGGGADGRDRPPTPAQRVDYWLDRLFRGPEEATWFDLRFHEMLRLDATENLRALPNETLSRLADPALQARVQTASDANPWHAVLDVIARIEADFHRSGQEVALRPDVVRAWAIPALDSPLLTLRRYAVPALAGLHSTEDGPILVQALSRDAADGAIASRAAQGLYGLGAPWDGLAARTLLSRAVADKAGPTSGLWTDLPVTASSATRGSVRVDLLAWWALLTETSGPRARDPVPGGGREARSIDPASMRAVAPDHAWTTGKIPGATARAALAKAGYAAYRRSVEADLVGPDPALSRLAAEKMALAGEAPRRDRVRLLAERMLTTLETLYLRPDAIEALLAGGDPRAAREEEEFAEGAVPSVASAHGLVRALAADDDPAATWLLVRLLLSDVPTQPWLSVLDTAHAALLKRGSAASDAVARLLERGEQETVARAFALIRNSRRPGYRLLLEPWLERPEAARYRPEGRRLLVYLMTTALDSGGVALEDLPRFTRRMAEWIADPADPSGGGLAASLLDLGPPGLAQFAEGLSGPLRATYVAAMTHRPGRTLGPEVIGPLLAPIGTPTPVPERRAALSAALATASSSCVPLLESLSRRLPPDGKADVAWILRIVAHRPP